MIVVIKGIQTQSAANIHQGEGNERKVVKVLSRPRMASLESEFNTNQTFLYYYLAVLQ